MKITFEPASLDEHFEQMITLQRQNLYTLIGAEQQAEQGFVFTEHTTDLLKKFAAQLTQIIALSDNRVVGYNLAMPTSLKNEVPVLAPMIDEFEKIMYKGIRLSDHKYIVGGQVCVAHDFRGMGLLTRMYNETKNHVSDDYDLCITEISVRNQISLRAHQKAGFKVIHTYEGAEVWDVVVWDMKGDSQSIADTQNRF